MWVQIPPLPPAVLKSSDKIPLFCATFQNRKVVKCKNPEGIRTMENFEKQNNQEKKEKPEVLYHASRTSGIKEFVPNRGNYRDEDEGAVIFSTPNKALASAFLVEGHGDHWMQIGFYGDIPVVVINADREEFIKNDKGGVMYAFPSTTFDYNPNKGMGDKEWTSRESVKPLSEVQYPSALNAMMENGVQVYFVDKKNFNEINNSDNHGYNILIGLTSENEKNNTNVRPLKDLGWE